MQWNPKRMSNSQRFFYPATLFPPPPKSCPSSWKQESLPCVPPQWCEVVENNKLATYIHCSRLLMATEAETRTGDKPNTLIRSDKSILRKYWIFLIKNILCKEIGEDSCRKTVTKLYLEQVMTQLQKLLLGLWRHYLFP